MSKYFIHLHQHDIMSNGGGYMEVVTSMSDYIDYAVEHNLPAVAISNHGNVVDWAKRKNAIEAAGLKYIHAIEAYVTSDNDETEKPTRDNYHLIMIAKNFEGVKEINRLSSKSFDRDSNHYYYKPRIYTEEVFNTSDNIIILTACLSSPLWKVTDEKEHERWIDFVIKNKHRVFLEVQPHLEEDQKEYNKQLLKLSEENGVPIIATNDAHALNKDHERIRKILKESKGMSYETDDDFELWAKTREEMVDSFTNQGVLTEEQIEIALDNTMSVVDQIEEFDLDRSHKYPKLFNKEEQRIGQVQLRGLRNRPFESELDVFRFLIVQGYKDRGLDKLSESEQISYKARVNHELEAYITTGSVGYMLLDYMVKKDAREKRVNPNKAIYPAYGRGSVSGSLIAYLLHITDIDSVKEDLNFERFMNKDRVSLADIDSDFAGQDRYDIMYYLLDHPDLYCGSIMTKNTYATMKSSIRAIGKGIGYDYKQLDAIAKQIDDDGNYPDNLRHEHEELFRLATEGLDTVESFGRHASGILVSSDPIDDVVGTMTLPKWDYPITQLSMKEIDYMNFVKLDILGLDNIELIEKATKMAGLPRLTPDSSDVIDFQDEKVWNEMTKSNIAVFQFESDRAGGLLKDMFGKDSIDRIRKANPDFRYIDLLSILSGGQRPAGASYIEHVKQGITKTWNSKPLDNFLKDTLGEVIFQEQQTQFLVEFCGWTVGEADLIRRGIGKKDKKIMDVEVPKIKPTFIKTMVEQHGDTVEHATDIADDFIQVFMDSVNYGFSKNHAQTYSYIGYISTWIRTYYPLEFVAAGLEVWGKGEKNIKILNYADQHGYKINPPKFRKSRGGYFIDKDNNSIFEGTGHIKGGNSEVGELLFGLKDRNYPYFTDLVIDIIENGTIRYEGSEMTTQEFYNQHHREELKEIDKAIKKDKDLLSYSNAPLGINKTKMTGLISLNFFEEFGQNKKLQQVYDYVTKNYKPNNKTFAGKQLKYNDCILFERSLPDERVSIIEQCEFELFYTGRVTTMSKEIPAKYGFVTNIDNVGKTRTSADVFLINKGTTVPIKVGSSVYRNAPFQVGDLVELSEIKVQPKTVNQGGSWVKSKTEKEIWIKQLKFIRKATISKKK